MSKPFISQTDESLFIEVPGAGPCDIHLSCHEVLVDIVRTYEAQFAEGTLFSSDVTPEGEAAFMAAYNEVFPSV